jgi:hypothetical protein
MAGYNYTRILSRERHSHTQTEKQISKTRSRTLLQGKICNLPSKKPLPDAKEAELLHKGAELLQGAMRHTLGE